MKIWYMVIITKKIMNTQMPIDYSKKIYYQAYGSTTKSSQKGEGFADMAFTLRQAKHYPTVFESKNIPCDIACKIREHLHLHLSHIVKVKFDYYGGEHHYHINLETLATGHSFICFYPKEEVELLTNVIDLEDLKSSRLSRPLSLRQLRDIKEESEEAYKRKHIETLFYIEPKNDLARVADIEQFIEKNPDDNSISIRCVANITSSNPEENGEIDLDMLSSELTVIQDQ